METTIALLIGLVLSISFALIAATGYIKACGKRPKK